MKYKMLARSKYLNDDTSIIEDKYEGWTNWDTWNAALWLHNDHIAYAILDLAINNVALSNEAKADELKFQYSQLQKRLNNFSTDGVNLEKVNWQEIVKHAVALQNC